jgi:DNA-binding NarL/FixJ family response regulator
MTREEVKTLLGILQVNYRSHFKDITPNEMKEMLDFWHMMLSENDSAKTFNALKAIITTDINPFPPTIGQINNKVYEMFAPKQITEQEIVKAIKRAISNGNYHAQSEWEDLPKEAQSLCSASQIRSWASQDESVVDSVIMSLVTRGYQNSLKAQKNTDMLPNSVKVQISEITKSLKLDNKD